MGRGPHALMGVTVLLMLIFMGVNGRAETLYRETGLNYWDRERAYNGYTLFASQSNTTGSVYGTAGNSETTYLLDMEGNVVHKWNIGGNSRLLDNGNLFAREDGAFFEVDWNGNVVWSYKDSRENYTPHHDYVRAFNPKLGEYTTFYIANRDVTHKECIALGCDPKNGPYDGAQVDTIVEVDMEGNIIWEWRFIDHLIQDIDPTKENYVGEGKAIADYPHRLNANLPGRPIRRDWLHLNAMDYNEQLDHVMFDTVQGEVYIIDHGNTFVVGDPAASIQLAAGAKGDLLYRFGDPARYGQGDPPSILDDWTRSTPGHKQIGGVHDIQWIDQGLPGAGHILMFNNAQYLHERMPQSYVFEVNPYRGDGKNMDAYVNPPDAGYVVWESDNPRNTHKEPKNLSNQIVWMYASKSGQNFFSHIGSSTQRLPNGNTLICADTEGHIFEVTMEGELVWEYINPVTAEGEIVDSIIDAPPMYNPVFRALRYGGDHPAFASKELISRGPISN